MKKRLNLFIRLSWMILAMLAISLPTKAQEKSNHGTKFEQLGTILPGGNQYRGMDGAPGPKYWQQRADYEIECRLDVDKLQLQGQAVLLS